MRSSFIFIFTRPPGASFFLAHRSNDTNISVTAKNTPAARIIISVFFIVSYGFQESFIPIKLIKPIAISPVTINAIPRPRKGLGMLE